MNKFCLLIVFVNILCSCSKENVQRTESQQRLSSIDYKSDGKQWTENFIYNGDFQLQKIKSGQNEYVFEYENGLIKKILNYCNDKLYGRDSFIYNQEGLLEKKYSFSISFGDNMPLDFTREYFYDDNNRVIEETSFSHFIQLRKVYTKKYFWNVSGNIQHIEEYNGLDELMYEYFMDYDNRMNFELLRKISFDDPRTQTNNNIIKWEAIDHYGNLNLYCNPCDSEYQYNENEMPTAVKYSYKELTLNYE